MAITAQEINTHYLNLMLNASEANKVFSRIKELWWAHFEAAFAKDPNYAINNLDLWMNEGQELLRKKASSYADGLGYAANSPEHIQRINQFLKSNTGKMFERFIGLAIAYYLLKAKSKYAIWAFKADLKRFTVGNFSLEDFEVSAKLGTKSFKTLIDSDLIVFNPEETAGPIFLISVKATLKDRFHNVPFWNMLRLMGISNDFPNVTPKNPEVLKRVQYIAVCSDLAKEQPDFCGVGGPRNMLCLDAALLDGAYVTASRAVGLGSSENDLGPDRDGPFFPLSTFLQRFVRADSLVADSL